MLRDFARVGRHRDRAAKAIMTEREVRTDRRAPETAVNGAEPESVRYARSFQDALRLGLFILITLVLLVLTVWVEDAILGLEHDVLALVHPFSARVGQVLTVVVQVLAILGFLAGALVPIVRRRSRLLAYVLVASVLSYLAVALVDRWLAKRQADSGPWRPRW
jgi:hypothetical protein